MPWAAVHGVVAMDLLAQQLLELGGQAVLLEGDRPHLSVDLGDILP
jgi:hypothetical protein